MARPLRIEFPGAWYHVMNRGGSRREIFVEDHQRNRFLKLLSDLHERWSVQAHAYCLMSNHYHLLLHTPKGDLSRAMRHLNGVYTQYFNRTQNCDGALFRGRYKAVLVQADVYWTHLSAYIHRNPVEANIVDQAQEYEWSSYRYYADRLTTAPEWLYLSEVLSQFSSRAAYRAFVEQEPSSVNGLDWPIRSQLGIPSMPHILGDEGFVEQVSGQVEVHPEVPASKTLVLRPTMRQVIETIAAAFSQTNEQITTPVRGLGATSPARGLAMLLCQELARQTLSEIADQFNLSAAGSAGASIRNMRQRLERDQRLRSTVESLRKQLVSSLVQRD